MSPRTAPVLLPRIDHTLTARPAGTWDEVIPPATPMAPTALLATQGDLLKCGSCILVDDEPEALKSMGNVFAMNGLRETPAASLLFNGRKEPSEEAVDPAASFVINKLKIPWKEAVESEANCIAALIFLMKGPHFLIIDLELEKGALNQVSPSAENLIPKEAHTSLHVLAATRAILEKHNPELLDQVYIRFATGIAEPKPLEQYIAERHFGMLNGIDEQVLLGPKTPQNLSKLPLPPTLKHFKF